MAQVDPVEMIAQGPLKHNGEHYQLGDSFSCTDKQCAQHEASGTATRKDAQEAEPVGRPELVVIDDPKPAEEVPGAGEAATSGEETPTPTPTPKPAKKASKGKKGKANANA